MRLINRFVLESFQADNIITVRTNFNTESESSGRDVWLDLTDDGRLTGTTYSDYYRLSFL